MLNPLHIDVVTETFPPEVNGVAMTLGRLTSGLRALGHRVRIYHPRQPSSGATGHNGRLSEHPLPGIRIPLYRELPLGWPATRRLVRDWERQRPDVLYVATEGPLGWSAIRGADTLGIPVVSGFHTNFHLYSKHYHLGLLGPAIHRYLRALHRKTDCTLAPTRALSDQLREQGFGRVEVLQRGVDTSLFNPGRRSNGLRRQWGARENDVVCLYVGRIAEEKNLDEAVAAVCNAQAQLPAVRFVLVGDGPMRSQLAHNYPDFVFCGMRQGEDLAQHYASGDLFLFPSRSETFGNVVTEAMASGLAVVAYNEAAAGDHIRHGVNGLLVDRSLTTPDFARMTLTLCRHPDRAHALGASAAHYAQGLNWMTVVEQFEAILSEQAGRHASET